MTLLEKAQHYTERFPPIIGMRLARQVDINFPVKKDFNKHDLLVFAFDWSQADEGRHFWNDIRKMYFKNENPPQERFLEIFRKYSIELQDIWGSFLLYIDIFTDIPFPVHHIRLY